MYSKRKLFIFHNKKVVTHIESQLNQSKYIEDLVANSLHLKEYDILSYLKSYLEKVKPVEPPSDISTSISNILNEMT
jgi:hypothetical protein